jgi:tetratricopeptide (TPR) repeat protein
VLRSGPFSDERIIGLLNSRFVPFYFDLGKGSPAGDDAGKAFVVAVKEELGGMSVPTPPVLLMTPEGELLAEVSNYASEEEVLGALRKVLEDHPEFAHSAAGEQELPRLERARIAHWLGDDEAARALLSRDRSQGESLFLAQIARRAGEFEKAVAALVELDRESRAADLALEHALIAWRQGQYADMLEALEAYPPEGARAAEAQYHTGLAQFHLGDPKTARSTWSALVDRFGENRWSYRADWAHSQTRDKGLAEQKRSFGTTGGKTLLGRHGYMGRQNPDLSPPK